MGFYIKKCLYVYIFKLFLFALLLIVSIFASNITKNIN